MELAAFKTCAGENNWELLDLDMLKAADLAIAPAHGELYALYLQGLLGLERIQFTHKSGIEAAEELLEIVAGSLLEAGVV